MEKIEYLFYILYISTVIMMYIPIRNIVVYFLKKEVHVFFSILGIILLAHNLKVTPANHFIFIDYLDPNFVATAGSFWFIYGYICRKKYVSFLSLLITSIIHPIYSVSLLLIYFLTNLLSKNYLRQIQESLFYSLAVIPYSILIYFISRDNIQDNLDLSRVHEIIRSPHHLKIPTLQNLFLDKPTYLNFYIFVIIFFILDILIKRLFLKKHFHKFNILKIISVKFEYGLKKEFKIKRLKELINGFLAYLFLVSSVNSFFRIGILIQLTPYKITVIFIPVIFIYLYIMIWKKFKLALKFNNQIVFKILILIILFSATLQIFIKQKNALTNIYSTLPNDMKGMINYITNNTNKNSLFLNYSNINIRTFTLRSNYFNFKTFRLYSSSQRDWYERLLTYYDIDKSEKYNYEKVSQIVTSKKLISIENVIEKINEKIDYILLNKNHKFTAPNFKLKFQNDSYALYERL
jgi:hypothetical protein